jgi:peptidyl-prolyl cis-trans isomerase C
VVLPRAAVPVPVASASFASEVAQLADGSLDDAIPTIAVALSLGAILYSSAGALKGFAALLGGAEATASHILVKDESTAVSLLERLRDGPQDNLEDRFAREAGKYSECPSKSKGGSLGTFKPGQMVKEFDGAVFNGPVGEIQGPVQTQFGYHLILVTDRKEPEEK